MEHETVDDLLRAWDAGGSIWTLEMGGLGPGYEQALQVAAVEFARAGKDWKPSGDKVADGKAWKTLCDAALKPIDDQLGGLSGAQFGAAAWLAFQWCHNGGPKALMARAEQKAKDANEEDRAILCSRYFPIAPDAPTTERTR